MFAIQTLDFDTLATADTRDEAFRIQTHLQRSLKTPLYVAWLNILEGDTDAR